MVSCLTRKQFMYLLGYDVGSSSVKASLLAAQTGEVVTSAFSPQQEMEILAAKPGWAEQHPNLWWKHLAIATKKVLADSRVDSSTIKAIGISYQMHGLVLVDRYHSVLRPAIIWCDSRAVKISEKTF